ncbi:MAG TPA: DUF998 domain-containing protein [Gemmatimonadota bacterium]
MTTSKISTLPRAAPGFATAAILCFAYSMLALLLLHILRPDLAPASSMISDYAVGQYGWVMATVFFVWGVGCLMLLLGLIRAGLRSGIAKLGAAMLGLVSLCTVNAFFPTDLPDAPETRSGFIHGVVFLVAMASFIPATLLLGVGFGRDSRWRRYRSTALTLALLNVAAVVLQFLTLHRGMPYGLVNRFVFAMMMAWFIATAIRLRAVPRDFSAS